MVDKSRLLSLLSLAVKAGRLQAGEDVCERALRSGEAKLVIVCGDASGNTRKKFENKAFYYNVPCRVVLLKSELSAAIGKMNRASAVITDSGFAESADRYIARLTGAV
jgi:ribosomal protein L7Ae-like RNA K-turn-binding protein